MRLKNVPGSREAVAASAFTITEPESFKGCWAKEIFGNNAPIRIEVGMLIRAIEKAEGSGLPNLRFIRMDAEDIEKVFDRGEIDRIYLNFSDPWPKDRHAKRRLTSKRFLDRFANILREDGIIEFKTDNRALFDFSLEEAPQAGWKVISSTFDLHADPVMNEGNIMTEYEEKFSSAGNPICKYVVTIDKNNKEKE